MVGLFRRRYSDGVPSNQERKKTMQKKQDRKGLALGALVALVGSLFVGVAPSQASESSVVVYPNGTTSASQTTMLGTEAFDIGFRFGNQVDSSLKGSPGGEPAAFGVKITKPAGVTLSRAVSYSSITDVAFANTASDNAKTEIVFSLVASDSPILQILLPQRTSVSPAVAITVTPFLDYDRDNVHDSSEPLGDPMTINFVPWSAMGTAVALADPFPGRTALLGSFTVAQGTMAWEQLDGAFKIKLESTADGAATTSSGINASVVGGTANTSASGLARGNFSMSFQTATDALTSSPTSIQSASADVLYQDVLLVETTTAISTVTGTDVTISPVVSANALQSGTATGKARVNSAFTLRAYVHSSSELVPMSIAGAFSVSSVGSSMDFDENSGVIINGTTFTSSAALTAALFAHGSAARSITVSTFGQDTPDTSATLAFKFTAQTNLTKTMTITFEKATYTATYLPTAVSGPAGTARSFYLTVADQFDVSSPRTDQRIAASMNLSGSVSETVSAPVVAGAATVIVTPVPAARTGSGTVTFTLQTYNQDSTGWDDGSNDSATWNVFASSSTDGLVSRTASVSASVSYGVNHSYSPQIDVTVVNSFSSVIVSAPGLVIQDANATTVTASDALTVQATNKVASFKFAGTKSGTYTVTFTSGTATTTSLVVIDAAPSNRGVEITLDTTQITPGKTKVITGKVVDANGNPVDTTATGENGDGGTASIVVTYTGDAGIIVGSMPTETDANGEFRLAVLTSAADRGTLTITATYLKAGAATAAADKVTAIQAVNVGAAAAATADQKITVGTFKGFVAIYTKGYMGQKLSAKVAGKWLVVDPIAAYKSNDYSRTVRLTGAGYTITVDLYIDGAFVRSEVVTTK